MGKGKKKRRRAAEAAAAAALAAQPELALLRSIDRLADALAEVRRHADAEVERLLLVGGRLAELERALRGATVDTQHVEDAQRTLEATAGRLVADLQSQRAEVLRQLAADVARITAQSRRGPEEG